MKRRKTALGGKWVLGSCGLPYLPAYARMCSVPGPRAPDLLMVPQNSTEWILSSPNSPLLGDLSTGSSHSPMSLRLIVPHATTIPTRSAEPLLGPKLLNKKTPL